MLTRDPTIKLVDIAHILGVRAANRQSMTENQGLDQVIRESYITLIILLEWLCHTAVAYEPLEIAEFTRTVSEANLAATKALVQLQALARAKNAPR